MRRTLLGFAAVAAVGAGVIAWQRTQIGRLRAQAARQATALDGLSNRLAAAETAQAKTSAQLQALTVAADTRTSPGAGTRLREGERRLILARYHDVLARMNLSSDTASRLENLLVARVEALVDAEDAAEQEGIVDGSPEMAQVETQATEDLDREIADLLGPAQGRLFEAPVAASTPVVTPVPYVVPVYLSPPPEPAPAQEYASAPDADEASAYAGYPLYPGYLLYPNYGPVAGAPYGGGRPVERRRGEPPRVLDGPGQVVQRTNLSVARNTR